MSARGNGQQEEAMSKLAGRVAVVTGAAQGIGATYAKALANAGAYVVVSDVLDPSPIVEQINAGNGQALGVIADVTQAESVRNLVDKATNSWGEVDILVNNAALFGQLARSPIADISSSDWDKVMAVNVRGTFECCKAVIPSMKKRKYGKIINVASSTVFMGQPMLLHYVASKGAVIAMTRAMARELGDDGICVNALAPGLTMSENVQKNFASDRVRANVMMRSFKREQSPDDLIGALIYLASSDSDFMTGQTLIVDGGVVMQ